MKKLSGRQKRQYPELISLLEKEEKNGGLYIDSVFDNAQWLCWSSDKVVGSPGPGH
jgi:hypothetical protein